MSISGITEGKLEKICESYMMNRGARDVIAFLSPYGITANKAIRFYKEYGNRAIETVKDHPYKLCEISGIGFLTADKIALSMGMHPLDPRRVDEGLLFTLVDAEGRGHLCLEKHAFIKAALKLLDTEGLTEEMAACRAMVLVNQGDLVCYGGDVFRSKTAAVEGALARAAIKQINNTPNRQTGSRIPPERRKQDCNQRANYPSRKSESGIRNRLQADRVSRAYRFRSNHGFPVPSERTAVRRKDGHIFLVPFQIK